MKRVSEDDIPGFSSFWAVWLPISRRNDGRGLARETYRKHILAGALPEDIIDGAKWYVRSLTERDREYVPLSSTWLNRAAYEDGCERERDFQRRQSERTEAVVVPIRPTGQTAFLKAFAAGKEA